MGDTAMRRVRLGVTRRAILRGLSGGGAGLASVALDSPGSAAAEDAAIELVRRLTGRIPTASSRVRLDMPAAFPNGYTVPMSLEVDSPMTDADHVRQVRVLAPGTSGAVISLSGNASANLAAPSTGSLAGIVIFQDKSSAAPISASGDASLLLTGTLYAPGATLSVTGNAALVWQGTAAVVAPLVASDLQVSGNAVFSTGPIASGTRPPASQTEASVNSLLSQLAANSSTAAEAPELQAEWQVLVKDYNRASNDAALSAALDLAFINFENELLELD
jgi:hypothetical protein